MAEARDDRGEPEPRLQVNASPEARTYPISVLYVCQVLSQLPQLMLDSSASIVEKGPVRVQVKVVCLPQVCSGQG